MNNEYVKHALPFLGSWLAYRAVQQKLSFCVTIRSRDQILFSRAYGYADQSKASPLTTAHMFRVASQTKMLTAIAIMQLAEQKRLQLSDAAITYLPWLKDHRDARFRAITILQLLSHTAGLMRDTSEGDYVLFKAPWPSRAAIQRIIRASDLVARPGQYVKYSNIAFALLGQIIEKVSARPYATYIKKTILEPLGLHDIVIDYHPALDRRIPIGYGLPFKQKRAVLSKRQSTKGMAPVKGAYATTEAMCSLAAALFDGNTALLRDSSKRNLQQAHSTISEGYDQGISFGLGTELQTVGERQLMGHGGHLAGHLTATFYDPRAGLAVSVAGNSKDTSSVSIVRGIFSAINHFCSVGNASKVDKKTSSFSARLRNEISTVEIVQSGTKIVAIDPDDWEPFGWCEALEIVNDTTLRVTDPHSLYNSGELLKYTYKNGAVHTVRFAGLTLHAESGRSLQ